MAVETPQVVPGIDGQQLLQIAQWLAARDRVSLSGKLVDSFTRNVESNGGRFVTALGKACHPAGGGTDAEVAVFRLYMWQAYDQATA